MGLLSQDYYKNALDEQQKQAQAATTPTQPQPGFVERVENKILSPITTDEQQRVQMVQDRGTSPDFLPGKERQVGMLTPEEQIKKYGGVVGSDAYLKYQADNPYESFLGRSLGETVGITYPDQQTWDKMTFMEKTRWTLAGAANAAAKMVVRAPRELVKAPVRLGYSFAKMEQGGWQSAKELAGAKPEIKTKREEINVPWLGTIPSYAQSYEDARKSGMGPWAAGLVTANTTLGDVTIAASLAESLKSGLSRPRVVAGKQVVNDVAPVKQALLEDAAGTKSVVKAPASSVNEYYSLPETVAKANGGSSNNTFLKITPVDAAGSEGMVEVSVVQVRKGLVQKLRDKISPKGNLYDGDFGPEIKIQSQRIPTGQDPFSELDPIVPPSKPAAPRIEADGTVAPETPEPPAFSILPKPLKGFENKPVTTEQITNLRQIMGANKIEPNTATAVMRNVTGKSAIGDLTQGEYVKFSQTLATFNRSAQYLGGEGAVNVFSQYLSPQRHWMRTFEEKSGVPLYSDIYAPMEDAIRLRDVFRDGYRNKAREIFGDYAGPKFAEERRLVKAYMEGDKSAILENPKLSPQVKSDLAVIADKIRPLYDELGAEFGIPTDVFLKDYQPHVKNIGGVFMVYKDAAEDIMNQLSFFADYKRTGSLTPQVDDALALFDIYTNAGSNKKFLNPVLERASEVGNALPPTLKNSVKSYIGEKLGHAGRVEQYINEMGPVLGNKLGLNLPPDIGRQMTQFIMDTSYSGALGLRPGAVIRNMLQNPLMTYPRLGPKFYAAAVKKALTAEGRAVLAEKGFTVDLGTPYGYELVKESANVGGRVGQAQQFYRKATQATLKPYSAADQFTRSATYWQAKYQWDDALTRLNEGKLTWNQFENEIDFQSLSSVDRGLVRKKIIDGNTEGAFDHYVRDVLDETQFPYRKGASSRVTYGLAGKLGTQFGQWNIEFVHTLGRWVKTGQWDKLIRFHAAATLTERTIKDTFGFNVDNWTGVDAVSPTPAPFVQFAQEFGGLISSWKDGSAETLEEHKDALIQQFKTMGRPAGLQIENWNNFWQSVKGGQRDDGQFPVYSRNGKLKYYAPFKDIWWKMWGFPSDAMSKDEKSLKDMRNAKFDYSQAKQKVLELWQQEKYDQATDLISEYNVQLTPQDFNAFYIPQTQRSYQALPAALKANFAPQVFK